MQSHPPPCCLLFHHGKGGKPESQRTCHLPEGHLHVLWLLPITAAEREFKLRAGVEALEQRFDDCGLEYWDPQRVSVV